MDPSVSALRNRIIATALSSFAGSPAFLSDSNISLFFNVPDLLRHREVYARRIVGSFCSIKDKNCFQPRDLENKSSIVTRPSPSVSSSSKNLLPTITAHADVRPSCGRSSINSDNEIVERLVFIRSTFDRGILSKLVATFCAELPPDSSLVSTVVLPSPSSLAEGLTPTTLDGTPTFANLKFPKKPFTSTLCPSKILLSAFK
ncbi:uncharacterized protein G2W53_025551 [Senna tora]|uniref:Uncharacterized protein n=1 Tax=Senna tora TaxID=362788 RepID=A0A834TFI2_9FABA|nr:uncharacterized protein G2W53_025551 [Senna tora]